MCEASGTQDYFINRLHYLSTLQKIGYSFGHILNDLCSGIWFSYFLVYMGLVLKFSSKNAGLLLLIGQIADGLSTTFIGFESDRIFFSNYGTKKTWHLIGTVCILISFPFIFNPSLGNGHANEISKLIYFSAFIIIFQFGWAAVQISHLSLIPILTPISNERICLNSVRYSFTVISNIAVYSITWIVLNIDMPSKSSHSSDENSKRIGPNSIPQFRFIVLVLLASGAIFSILFHIIVREKPSSVSNYDQLPNVPVKHLKWKDWFSHQQFYIIGFCYTATRLSINLTQVYMPFYLQFTLDLPKGSIAYIPLVMYCSGLFASFFTKWSDAYIGKKITFFLSGLLAIVTYVLLYFGQETFFLKYGIYVISGLLGLSGSIMLINVFGMTNDLIAYNTSSGAFVFGAMSFLDKIINGLAIFIIQKVHPTNGCEGNGHFYQNVLIFVCGSSASFAIFAVIILLFRNVKNSTQSLFDTNIANGSSEENRLINAISSNLET